MREDIRVPCKRKGRSLRRLRRWHMFGSLHSSYCRLLYNYRRVEKLAMQPCSSMKNFVYYFAIQGEYGSVAR